MENTLKATPDRESSVCLLATFVQSSTEVFVPTLLSITIFVMLKGVGTNSSKKNPDGV